MPAAFITLRRFHFDESAMIIAPEPNDRDVGCLQFFEGVGEKQCIPPSTCFGYVQYTRVVVPPLDKKMAASASSNRTKMLTLL
jgi:hypothetical protein